MEIKEFHEITNGCLKKYKLNELSLSKGQFLFTEKDPIDFIYFLLKGELSVLRNNQNLWQAQKNEFMGISSYFIGEPTYSYSVKANKPSRLIEIQKVDFDEVLMESPALNNSLMHLFCQRIDSTLDKVKTYSDFTRKKRILDFMIKKSKSENSLGSKILNYTIADIAEIVHISKYYTQNFLKELQSKKMIKLTENKIEITDYNGLNLLLKMKEIIS